jgi:predicted SAM-dependent methyltransferase
MTNRVLLNAGCGDPESDNAPKYFSSWQNIRLDLDTKARPDIVANIVELECIRDSSVDAIWSSHSLEHLYRHELPRALSGFRRVLRPDGFVCILVPDLQIAAKAIVDDKLTDPIYRSQSGPVTAHDMIFGFGPAIAMGSTYMAHRCGFTPTALGRALVDAGFIEVVVQRRTTRMELSAVALKKKANSEEERQTLITSLGI